MGLATVALEPVTLDVPVQFRDRSFPVGFDLSIKCVAPPHEGLDLAGLAGQLDALPCRAHGPSSQLATCTSPNRACRLSRASPEQVDDEQGFVQLTVVRHRAGAAQGVR